MISIKHDDERKLRTLLDMLINFSSQKADVIVWLQGDRMDRGKKVLELYITKQAGKILISGNNTLVGVGPRPGENDLPLNDLKDFLISSGVPEKDIFIESRSLNSAQQAKNVMMLARKECWKSMILVTSPYHQPRIFLSFLKILQETKSNVILINQPANDLPWEGMAGGRDQTRSELWPDEINKINEYSKDVSSAQEGIDYLLKML